MARWQEGLAPLPANCQRPPAAKFSDGHFARVLAASRGSRPSATAPKAKKVALPPAPPAAAARKQEKPSRSAPYAHERGEPISIASVAKQMRVEAQLRGK
jgi:hypothetical protein